MTAALLAVAGCGGDEERRTVGQNDCGTQHRALSGPTTLLTYRGFGRLDSVVPVLCERLRGLDISHRVRLARPDRVVIEVPRPLPPAVEVSDVKAVARTGRLSFYDWEPLVIGPAGTPEPGNAGVTGGPAAGRAGALTLYESIRRAKQRAAKVEPDNSREGSLFFAVDPRRAKVYGSSDRPTGAHSRGDALADVPARKRKDAVVHEIKPDTVILRAEQSDGAAGPAGGWFVLKDDVALHGSAIRNPKQVLDEGPGASGMPAVAFDFTDEAAGIWQRFTRAIADRGRRMAGRLSPDGADAVNQHFAIVLDDEIVSIPYIDFRHNPEGIDGEHGSLIQGGFTVKSARQLATVLRAGALTVPLVPSP